MSNSCKTTRKRDAIIAHRYPGCGYAGVSVFNPIWGKKPGRTAAVFTRPGCVHRRNRTAQLQTYVKALDGHDIGGKGPRRAHRSCGRVGQGVQTARMAPTALGSGLQVNNPGYCGESGEPVADQPSAGLLGEQADAPGK